MGRSLGGAEPIEQRPTPFPFRWEVIGIEAPFPVIGTVCTVGHARRSYVRFAGDPIARRFVSSRSSEPYENKNILRGIAVPPLVAGTQYKATGAIWMTRFYLDEAHLRTGLVADKYVVVREILGEK